MSHVHSDPLLVKGLVTECALMLELCFAAMPLSVVVDQTSLSLTNKHTFWLSFRGSLGARWTHDWKISRWKSFRGYLQESLKLSQKVMWRKTGVPSQTL